MERDEQVGEIHRNSEDDVAVNDYTPLERPENYAPAAPLERFPEVSKQYSDSDDESQSSDSNSDLETNFKAKQSKETKLPKNPLPKRQNKAKKYDIGSTRAQEDVLAETMNRCDVSLRDRSRGVESYDYTVAKKYYEKFENKKQGTERTRDNMKNYKFLPKKRLETEEEFNGAPKTIPDLIVENSNSVEEIVKDIASKLKEKKDDLILKVVEVMGKEKAIEIFKKTSQIEINGGMPIMNQTRRKTSGGIFLYLVKTDYHTTPEQKKIIFDNDKQICKEKKKKKFEALKKSVQLERNKLWSELLTRAELANKNVKTEEENCTNPPPSPGSDNHESGEVLEPQILSVVGNNEKKDDLERRIEDL